MKLTPACLVILLAISCLNSPVNGRSHPDLSSRSDSDWQSDTASKSDSSTSSQDSSTSSQDSSKEDSYGGFDECSSSPCQNGGTCIVATNDYSCTCIDGFLGRNCEEFNECSSSPCQNGGTCIDATNDYNCTCVDGFLGRNCEEFDECSSSPCQNGGTCIDATNDYSCTCVGGYFGRNCEDFQQCLQGWVLYYGSCYYFSQTKKTWEGARSDCLSLSMNVGHLVDIHSQAEQDFVNSQLPPNNFNDYWLGLNDIEIEKEYVWADTYVDVNFTFWWSGFTGSSSTKDCVYLYYTPDMVLSTNEGWDFRLCTDLQRYICEMKAFYN